MIMVCVCITTPESKINGRLFLKLPEDEKLLNPLELSYQFKVLILGKVEEVTEITDCKVYFICQLFI